MFRLERLLGCRLIATDGAIGTIGDCLIDDRLWVLRWLVVDIGSWFRRRRVILSPMQVEHVRLERQEVAVRLSGAEVRESAGAETEPLPSRNWTPLLSFGPGSEPLPPMTNPSGSLLRSLRELSAYAAAHNGRRIAKVEDFIVDELDWSVRFLIAGVGRWTGRRRVAVPTAAIAGISWLDRLLSLKITAGTLRRLPLFDGRPRGSANDRKWK